MEHAAVEVADGLHFFDPFEKREVQVQLFWSAAPLCIRQLAQASVAKLVCVSGIVIKASAAHARCVRAAIQCTSCRSKSFVPGGRSVDLPPQCLEGGGADGGGGGARKCRPNPYVVLPSESEYEDQQVIKLQELPEDVPAGELPRHLTAVVDRYLVDKMTAGSRVHLVGIVSVQEKRGGGADGGGGGGGNKERSKAGRATAGLRAQYVRCVGAMQMAARCEGGVIVLSINHNYSSRVRSRATVAWQADEEASFHRFAHEPLVYERLAESIDPAVFGLKDQKRAIACLLFGGTRKKMESNYLRGDMNVLLIGDPSTAKSQLLKFTERIAPIGVYTSGKGSSAAGLTASVVGNGSGDFFLEAGSMVLADGGVVCIDEFDKMREQDQVAIHEAMEQQTISVAKANLTTMLNSRTSVLAAANPSLGSYDPLRSNEEQMDFQGSILSRFDLIFKVIDPKNAELDNRLAQHVISLHKGVVSAHRGTAASDGGRIHSSSTGPLVVAPMDRSFVKKYIAYAKATCQPVIGEEAVHALLNFYVQVRRDSHKLTLDALASGGMSGSKSQAPIIQITPRQLESLVRISESLAKMRLDKHATLRDAEEAIRLFKAATVDAINSGVADANLMEVQTEAVQKIEDAIRRRIAVGSTVEHARLVPEMMRIGFDSKLLDRAVYIMMRREELEWRKQRTLIHRLR
jgi:DNA replication licensing factor MCM5